MVTTSEANWIVGVQCFGENPYHGHTLEESIEAMRRWLGKNEVEGFRGEKKISKTSIHVAGYARETAANVGTAEPGNRTEIS